MWTRVHQAARVRVHMARWCDGGRTQRSRLGTLTDMAVKTAKRRVAWTLTRTVVRMINGFNSCCLHAITGEDYRTTATVPAYNLVLAERWLSADWGTSGTCCICPPRALCDAPCWPLWREVSTTRRAASSVTARPGYRSWKPCRWIARLGVRKCRRWHELCIFICASVWMLYHRTLGVYRNKYIYIYIYIYQITVFSGFSRMRMNAVSNNG